MKRFYNDIGIFVGFIERRVTIIRKDFGYFGIRKEKDDLWIDSSHREFINR